MNTSFENETWIIEAGAEVLQKMAADPGNTLSSKERLIHCLWVLDYCMRNAGDLIQAEEMHPDWRQEGAQLAQVLSLHFTHESFSVTEPQFQEQYFARFDAMCDEIKALREH